jgi:predicted molibdopterin-dependent oxidoreductase YjgC
MAKRCKDCVVGLLGACGLDYCRQEREALIEEALLSAEARGHALSEFVKVQDHPIWEARCVHCGQLAAVCLDPAPNEPDVYGEALTTDCPKMDPESESRPASPS